METVTVNAEALRTVLKALMGAPYQIRELQATMNLPGETNPIVILVDEYNLAVSAHNAKLDEEEPDHENG